MPSIQLDKPRRLKFGFNAIEHLSMALDIANPMEAFVMLEQGDVKVIKILLESCLIGDNEGIDSLILGDLLDTYVDDFGLTPLTNVMKETIQESGFFKEAKKQQAKANKKNKNKK